MKTIKLTNDQLCIIKAVLLQYIKDGELAASECEHDEELHDFFLERAKNANSVYKALIEQ